LNLNNLIILGLKVNDLAKMVGE